MSQTTSSPSSEHIASALFYLLLFENKVVFSIYSNAVHYVGTVESSTRHLIRVSAVCPCTFQCSVSPVSLADFSHLAVGC